MCSPPDISVVVACFDEEEALPPLFVELDRLRRAAAERGLSVETVFVDDGSRDGTAALLARHAAEGPGRRVVTHPGNRGFGAALRTGLAAAGGRAIVCYDADATYPVLDVLRLVDALAGADVAGASPFAPGGAVAAGPWRRLLSRAAATVHRVALRDRGRGISALTCAFRACRREALPLMPFRADGFLAAAEALCLLVLAGGRYREVPSALSARRHGRSKMRALAVAAGHLSLAVRVALRAGRFLARPRPRPARRPAAAAVAAVPARSLSAWNAALNRAAPMRLIDAHRNPLVRRMEERRRTAALRLLGPCGGGRVLDVGAEEGALARRLAGRGARVTPLDVDPAVLPPGGVAADASRLPFRRGAFPRVLLSEVLEHCPDPARAAAEAVRVAGPGGRVALTVPDDGLVLAAKRLLRLLGLSSAIAGLPAGRAPGHLHVFTAGRLRAVLAGAGRLRSFARDFPSLSFHAVISAGEGRGA